MTRGSRPSLVVDKAFWIGYADELEQKLKDSEGRCDSRDKVIYSLETDLEIATVFNQEQARQLETIKKKARAAVNAPYEDILDMGLAQALRELEEALPPP